MTKILWHGNCPWAPTGYGGQCALFAPYIAERYTLAISSNYGLEGAPLKWGEVPVLPGLGQDWGNNTIVGHAEHFFGGNAKDGIVLTLADVWPLEPRLGGEVNLACWVPVDHDPVPPKVDEFLRTSGAVPIAMSKFGAEQLAELDPLYVPHGVDTEALKPIPKEEARGGTFHKDAFVVGMIAANKGHPSRKAFSQALYAWAKFAEKHDDAYIYLHTSLGHQSHGGENLYALLSRLGIPSERVRSADQYSLLFAPYTLKDMARIYSSLDVLMNPSFGEGFGIPIIEAQACGTPVIVNEFTAMPELCGAGWMTGHDPFWTMLNSWQAIPKIDDIYDALEECYSLTKSQRQHLSNTARKFALGYDVRMVLKRHWWPTLREVERRIEERGRLVTVPRTATVAVITPWYNHPEFRTDYDAAMAVAEPDEVLIIDSGSDPPVEGAAYRFETNVGQTPACNKGLELAESDIVVFLNNDIKHVRADWLDALISQVEPGKLVGPLLRDGAHTVVDGINYPYLDGWCLAGYRQDFERLGGWDTSYREPSYYGDNDLSLRAFACGMRLLEAQVGLEHISNGTSGDDPVKRETIASMNRQIYEHRVRELRRLAA